MIDLTINDKQLQQTIEVARERNIVIPTFEQMKNPELIPDSIKQELNDIGLWEIHPRNLFRITWKNEPNPDGGLYGDVNYVELPSELTGVKARIFCVVGKWFPTGAHKVGATFGCLAPRLTTGQFDPVNQIAVWPSTGNYCRGGAYDAALLGCDSIAILPEEMSPERFEWLSKVAGEVFTTPGGEADIKAIFDKCWELRKDPAYKDKIVIFNQFDEYGNHLWHYQVTGGAMAEVLNAELKEGQQLAATILTSGSSGTLASGDRMKDLFPGSKLAVGEALQCPTLLENGYGSHRIEGIGDKHVPWVHNVRNTDTIVAIDDEDCMRLVRFFNEPVGRDFLKERGVDPQVVDNLDLMGISGIANVLGCIKYAKKYELTENDALMTVWTDSMELYNSRLEEMRQNKVEYTEQDAARAYEKSILDQNTANILDLQHEDKRRIHNLKYFTWIEQQEKQLEELDEQWQRWPAFWDEIHGQAEDIDQLINQFNDRVGII